MGVFQDLNSYEKRALCQKAVAFFGVANEGLLNTTNQPSKVPPFVEKRHPLRYTLFSTFKKRMPRSFRSRSPYSLRCPIKIDANSQDDYENCVMTLVGVWYCIWYSHKNPDSLIYPPNLFLQELNNSTSNDMNMFKFEPSVPEDTDNFWRRVALEIWHSVFAERTPWLASYIHKYSQSLHDLAIQNMHHLRSCEMADALGLTSQQGLYIISYFNLLISLFFQRVRRPSFPEPPQTTHCPKPNARPNANSHIPKEDPQLRRLRSPKGAERPPPYPRPPAVPLMYPTPLSTRDMGPPFSTSLMLLLPKYLHPNWPDWSMIPTPNQLHLHTPLLNLTPLIIALCPIRLPIRRLDQTAVCPQPIPGLLPPPWKLPKYETLRLNYPSWPPIHPWNTTWHPALDLSKDRTPSWSVLLTVY